MKSFKINISIAVLLFINFLFCYKYISRHTAFGIYMALLLLIVQFLVFKFGDKVFITKRNKNIIGYCFICFIGGLILFSHQAIPIESLNVDRWSVISSFLTELYDGNYPYYAKSHMGNFPGPMPVYFLIAAPFHALGELSILSSIGYIIISILLIKRIAVTKAIKFLLFYLFTSFYLIWEITTRSNIFTYSVLALLVLNAFIYLDKKDKIKFYVLAVLTGFMLSTRSVYVLPYIVFFLSSLIHKEVALKRMFLFIFIAFLSFLSTFLPLVWVFYDDFFTMNPFIIQSSFLVPKFYIIFFVLIAVLLSLLVKNKNDKFFYSGISLFIAILIYSFYHIANHGLEVALIDSKIDISYFILCIPFLVKYLIGGVNSVET